MDDGYEYRVETLASLRDSKALSKMIVKLGEQGWELVDKQSGGLLFGKSRVTFRRPKVGAATHPSETTPRVRPGLTAEQTAALEQIEVDVVIGRISQAEHDVQRAKILEPKKGWWR